MKVKVSSGQSSATAVQQCPHCSGSGVNVQAESSSSCSTCRKSRRGGRKNSSATNDGLVEQKVYVVSVGNSKSHTSLFGRLFGKSEREGKLNLEIVQPSTSSLQLQTSHRDLKLIAAPNRTLLEVKSSSRLSSSADNISIMKNETQETNSGDLCTKCNIYPAQISVTNSRGMVAEKLCRRCRALSQAPKKSPANQLLTEEIPPIRRSESVNPINNNRKTVVVVSEGGRTPSLQAPESEALKKGSSSHGSTERLLKILEDIKSTVLNSGAKELPSATSAADVATAATAVADVASNAVIKVATSAPAPRDGRLNVVSVHIPTPMSQEVKNPRSEVRSEVQDLNLQDGGVPVTVLSLSSSKLLKNNTVVGGQNTSAASQQWRPDRDPLASVATSIGESGFRPEPFNPDYRSTLGRSSVVSLEMPPELEAVNQQQVRSFQSKAEEIFHGNLQRSANRAALMDDGYFSVAPPRYEDIIRETEQVINNNGPNQVYFAKSFGRYSEISTQPGGLNNPTTVKLSRHPQPQAIPNSLAEEADVVVVTDLKLSTVQVFDFTGECLALVKVQGVKSCCPIDAKRLVVGTDDRIVVVDYDGVEKLRANLDNGYGEVSALSPLKTQASFVALAQSRAVSIYDCRFSSLVVVKKLTSAGPKMPFSNLVDLAFTNNDDLVALEASANGGTAAIFVIKLSTGELKSAIYPKHESCGPLSNPAGLAVDMRNRIFVSDPGNGRILLFIATKQSGSASGQQGKNQSKIQVMTLDGLRLKGSTGSEVAPAGMDINSDNFIFLIVKGTKMAEVRVYSR